MKKRVAVLLAAMCALGMTAFAASPYDDVSPDHWAYKSVVKLTEAGVIDGYPDGEFKGERNITRYEMAQMIARAMENSYLATPEQQADINRLVSYYADDLKNLDKRLGKVEDRLDRVAFKGEAKVYYNYIGMPSLRDGAGDALMGLLPDGTTLPTPGQGTGPISQYIDFAGLLNSINKAPDYLDDGVYAKIRIGLDYNLTERTQATLGVKTADYRFGDKDSVEFEIDEAQVTHRMGDWTFTGGRMFETLGSGYYFGDSFDGVRAQYQMGKTSFDIGYGKFTNLYCGSLFSIVDNFANGQAFHVLDEMTGADHTVSHMANKLADLVYLGDAPKAWYFQVGHEFTPDLQVKAFYFDTTGYINYKAPLKVLFNTITPLQPYADGLDNINLDVDYVETYGLAASYKITDDFKITGEWGRNNSQLAKLMHSVSSDSDSAAQYWLARLDYKGADVSVPGSYGAHVDYKDFDFGAYFGGTATDYDNIYLSGVRSWSIGGEYVPIENLLISALYTFEAKPIGVFDDLFKLDDHFRIQATYYF